MNQALSLRPTQAGRALVLLAALGFTALVGLAALEPATEAAWSTDVVSTPVRPVEAGADVSPVRSDTATPRFERSNESEIYMDPANPHGG